MPREIDDLLPFVLPYAQKCPELVAIPKIRDAARRYCTATRIWRESETMTVSSPECTGISTIPDAALVAIEAAILDGTPLTPKTVGWLDSELPGWDHYEEDVAAARYITQLAENTVTVVPKATGSLTLRAILKPSLTAYTVPDILVENHAVAIGKSAAAELLMMPDPDWQNPQLALVLRQDFDRAIAEARSQAQRGQQQARTRSVGRYL